MATQYSVGDKVKCRIGDSNSPDRSVAGSMAVYIEKFGVVTSVAQKTVMVRVDFGGSLGMQTLSVKRGDPALSKA